MTLPDDLKEAAKLIAEETGLGANVYCLSQEQVDHFAVLGLVNAGETCLEAAERLLGAKIHIFNPDDLLR